MDLDLTFGKRKMEIEARANGYGQLRGDKGTAHAEILDTRSGGLFLFGDLPGDPHAAGSGDALVSPSLQIGARSHIARVKCQNTIELHKTKQKSGEPAESESPLR